MQQWKLYNRTVSVAITVLHEVETTGDIFSSAADNEMLIYGGGGAGLLLIILLVIVVKREILNQNLRV